jgi:hypothetical protein
VENSGEMIIRLSRDGRIQVQETDGLALSYKEIEPDAFLDCIRHSLKHGRINSGLLPQNCFHFSVDTDGTRYAAMEFPVLTADITYEKTLYKNFPLPKLVFGFGVTENGKLLRTWRSLTASRTTSWPCRLTTITSPAKKAG